MIPEEFQSLGFKEMHPMQIEALMEVVAIALRLAAAEGDEVYDATEEAIDDMVKLFGGKGVFTTVEVY